MTVCTDARAEERLNLYVDGELPAAEQSALFGHLAACADCRDTFNALLAFRLAVRHDALAVPPAADEAFLARLDRLRRATHPAPDRAAERRLFGDTLRRRVPLGSALAAAVVLIALGLLARPVSPPASAEEAPFRLIEVVTDDGNALYVMDGVTVESEQADG